MTSLKKQFLTISLLLLTIFAMAEDGYELWLRYKPVEDQSLLKQYRDQINDVVVFGQSENTAVIKSEIIAGLSGLLDNPFSVSSKEPSAKSLVIGTPSNSNFINQLGVNDKLKKLGNEGYLIIETGSTNKKSIVIASLTDIGALYGTFHFLRLIQTNQSIAGLNISEKPAKPLGQSRPHSRTWICRLFDLGLAQTPRFHRSKIH